MTPKLMDMGHASGPRSDSRSRTVPRDVALRALSEGVDACGHCRPGAALGYLDGSRQPRGGLATR